MNSCYKVVDDKIFRKFYHSSYDARQEYEFYQNKLGFIPRLIEYSSSGVVHYIDFEYIDSCSLWQQAEIDFCIVAKLYADLHNYSPREGKVICQIDTNPKNIIISRENGRYYLIDFVDWRWEYPEFDIIHFLLFWASAKPAEQFSLIVEQFLSAYQRAASISTKRWNDLLPQVISFFDLRRRIYQKKEKNNNPDMEKNRQTLNLILSEWS
jgi:thiamine kinase-like enzyme